MGKICVFAGTADGNRLIDLLAERGAEIIACTATEYGASLLAGRKGVRVRSGRMDAEQMRDFLQAERVDAVVDATHPYADRVTENLALACGGLNIEYLRLLRASSADAADGIWFANAAACAEGLKSVSGNILLTTGSKELPVFCAEEALRERLWVRVLPIRASLEICESCGIRADHICAMQGPFDEEMNMALMRAFHISALVTKDTGDAGGYAAKIHAAERTGAKLCIIGRPAERSGVSMREIAARLEEKFGLTPLRKQVTLAGIGLGDWQSRTLGVQRAIEEADCVIGAQRMLDSIRPQAKASYAAVDPKAIAAIIRREPCRRFVVLFSGDTGFYSGAKRLAAELADVRLRVLPGIASLQGLCARIGRGWEDVRTVSLHGRSCDLAAQVRGHRAVFALLGGEDGVKDALEQLIDGGLTSVRVSVGERLGYPDERITCATPHELMERQFDPLSVMLVENPDGDRRIVTHGLPDEAFERDATPMTKSEVRSISLSKLELTAEAIVYDVGAGSGSVTVELARLANRGRVYAIERKESAVEMTRRNARKFGLSNVEIVHGTAPEALKDLPAPTHVFIGGSAGNMRRIIDAVLAKNARARLVVNAVTLETLAELTEIGRAFQYCDVAQVSVSKPRSMGQYRLMTAQNPVYIFTLQN